MVIFMIFAPPYYLRLTCPGQVFSDKVSIFWTSSIELQRIKMEAPHPDDDDFNFGVFAGENQQENGHKTNEIDHI